jgi:hypothetical protein
MSHRVHDVMKDPSRSIAICPGGFSEAVFADARDPVEYSFIKDRLGFIKMAIWYNRDIVPVYSFGQSQLYYTVRSQRALRAKIAQKYRVPMVAWLGMLVSNQPNTNTSLVTVFGKPFPTSSYRLDQVAEAHAAYLLHVHDLFYAHRDKAGTLA